MYLENRNNLKFTHFTDAMYVEWFSFPIVIANITSFLFMYLPSISDYITACFLFFVFYFLLCITYWNFRTVLDPFHLKKKKKQKQGHTRTNWNCVVCATFQQGPYKDNCMSLFSQCLQVFNNLDIFLNWLFYPTWSPD